MANVKKAKTVSTRPMSGAEKSGFLDTGKHGTVLDNSLLFSKDLHRAILSDSTLQKFFPVTDCVKTKSVDPTGKGAENVVKFATARFKQTSGSPFVLSVGDSGSGCWQEIHITPKPGVSREAAERALKNWLRASYAAANQGDLLFRERQSDGIAIDENEEVLPDTPPSTEARVVIDSLQELQSAINAINPSNGSKVRVNSAFETVKAAFTVQNESTQEAIQQFAKSEQEKAEAERLFIEADEKNKKLQLEVNRLTQQLDDAKKREQTRTDIQFLGSASEMNDPEQQVQQLRVSIDTLTNERNAARDEVRDATGKLAVAVKLASGLSEELGKEQRKRDQLTAEAGQATATIATLEGQIKTLREAVQDADTLRQTVATEAASIQQSETSLRAAFGAQAEKVRSLQAEHERKESALRATLAGQSATIERLKERVTTLQDEIAKKSIETVQSSELLSLSFALSSYELATQKKLDDLQRQHDELSASLAIFEADEERVAKRAELQSQIAELSHKIPALEQKLNAQNEAIDAATKARDYKTLAALSLEAEQLELELESFRELYQEVSHTFAANERAECALRDSIVAIALQIKQQHLIADALSFIVRSLPDNAELGTPQLAGARLELVSSAQADGIQTVSIDNLIPLEPISDEPALTATRPETPKSPAPVSTPVTPSQQAEFTIPSKSIMLPEEERKGLTAILETLKGLPVQLIYTAKSQQRASGNQEISRRAQESLGTPGVELASIVEIVSQSDLMLEAMDNVVSYLNTTQLTPAVIAKMRDAIEAGITEIKLFNTHATRFERAQMLKDHTEQASPRFRAMAQLWREARSSGKTRAVTQTVTAPPKATTPKAEPKQPAAQASQERPVSSSEVSELREEFIEKQVGLPMQLLFPKSKKRDIVSDKRRIEAAQRQLDLSGIELAPFARKIVESTTLSQIETKLKEYFKSLRHSRKVVPSIPIIKAILQGMEEAKIFDKTDQIERLTRLNDLIESVPQLLKLGELWRDARKAAKGFQ